MLNINSAGLGIRAVKTALLCLIAASLNCIIHPLLVPGLKLPLFADTVFTAAVTFYAGLFPGLVTALLTWVIGFAIKDDIITPFIICSIAEVFIIFLLKPPDVNMRMLNEERKRALFVSILARLMILYITVCITVSILGGIIDYVFYTILPNSKPARSAEDAFKGWLSQSPLHALVINILSRIPVNLIDRFIVILGGYFLSISLKKILKTVRHNQ